MIVNTAQGGGSGVKLNLFAQPDEPETKDGIWLETVDKKKLKKVIFDTNPWAAGSWQNPSEIQDFPYTYSYQAVGTVFDGSVYFFLGSNSCKYNPLTNTYTDMATCPYSADGACCATVGSQIYIYGARDDDKYTVIMSYTPGPDVYMTLMHTAVSRVNAGCVVYNNEVYLFGGASSNVSGAVYSSAATKYTNGAENVTSLSNMPWKGSIYNQCAAVGGKVYIFGHFESNPSSTESCCYDIASDTYTTISALPAGRISAFCCAIGDTIYIFGGVEYKVGKINEALCYRPLLDTYTSLANMPDARSETVGAFIGDSVYLFGGVDVNGQATASVLHYMLTSKQYDDTPAAVIHWLPADATYQTKIVTSKLSDIPVVFKDAMFYNAGNLTFPALYVGNGTQWTLARSAQ